jgi:hypothetical protein
MDDVRNSKHYPQPFCVIQRQGYTYICFNISEPEITAAYKPPPPRLSFLAQLRESRIYQTIYFLYEHTKTSLLLVITALKCMIYNVILK